MSDFATRWRQRFEAILHSHLIARYYRSSDILDCFPSFDWYFLLGTVFFKTQHPFFQSFPRILVLLFFYLKLRRVPSQSFLWLLLQSSVQNVKLLTQKMTGVQLRLPASDFVKLYA